MQNPSFRPFGDPTLTQLSCFSQKIKSVSIKKEVHGTYCLRSQSQQTLYSTRGGNSIPEEEKSQVKDSDLHPFLLDPTETWQECLLAPLSPS